MMKVPELLAEAAKLYEARNKRYKDNYKRVGVIHKALFPDGLVLNTEAEFNRYALVINIVNKLTRYTFNFSAEPNSDHLDDLAVYAMMLQELDQDERE